MQKYSNDIKSQALALEAEGVSTRRTVERLRAMFPGEAIPTHKSVAVWRRECHGRLHEELEDAELTISRQADELVVEKLNWSKDHMDKARLAELVMAAGVYRDKNHKRHEKPAPGVQNIQINFISQEAPDD